MKEMVAGKEINDMDWKSSSKSFTAAVSEDILI